MRNLNLLPALKFHCTTKMEVVEEINRIRDDRLDFLETFEEHREAFLLPRVLWLFGQRMGASRDSGIMEKDILIGRLHNNGSPTESPLVNCLC